MERDRVKKSMERSGYVESNFFEKYHIFAGEETEAKTEDLPKKEKSKKEKSKSKTTPKPKSPKAKKNKLKKAKIFTAIVIR